MKLYKAALPMIGLAAVASACNGNVDNSRIQPTQSPVQTASSVRYDPAKELSEEYRISYTLANGILHGQRYVQGFSEDVINLDNL